MSFQIALNFEDGVTRFIECKPNEVVSDASYRQRINIPLDCRDGVCGTCKSFCESGEYELGDYVPDEAMTEDEEEAGYVLTCQMTPKSDCIIRIPATSDVAKTSLQTFTGELASNDRALRHRARVLHQAGQPVVARLPARAVRQHPGARHRPGPLVLVQLRAGSGRGLLPHPEHHPRRSDDLPAGPRQARRQDLVQRPAGQLLPAQDRAAGAVPGRGHGPRAVPVDAAQDRAGRRQRAPDPPDLRRDQRRRPGQGRRARGLRRPDAQRHRSPAWWRRRRAAIRTRATSPTT